MELYKNEEKGTQYIYMNIYSTMHRMSEGDVCCQDNKSGKENRGTPNKEKSSKCPALHSQQGAGTIFQAESVPTACARYHSLYHNNKDFELL